MLVCVGSFCVIGYVLLYSYWWVGKVVVRFLGVMFMLCFVCKIQILQMVECYGIEIDYCFGCCGVWLDCGELDKIIECVGVGVVVLLLVFVQVQLVVVMLLLVMYCDICYLGQCYEDNCGQQYGYGYKKKKKDSFLLELFDFQFVVLSYV